jgi:hypothetical protein
MEKKFHFVYLTTNLVNGKQYVGDHSSDCVDDDYIGSGRPYFKSAVHLHGKKNFERKILEFFETKELAFNAQSKYIIEYQTLYPNGYNLSPTGGCMKNGMHSKESIEKMRKKHKGVRFTQEHKDNIGKSRKNIKYSEESKHLMSIHHAGGWKPHTS